MGKSTDIQNRLKTICLTVMLGAVTGLVIWCFLKAVSLCTTFIWEFIPDTAGNKWVMVAVCALGGLAVGLVRKKYGDYPETLDTVMGKIKKDKHYSYHPMPVLLLCAFIPLVFGSSVGPEAGLTGIIAALCYWIGDNVTFAKKNATLYSELGEVVTLGQLFGSPLFGIFAVVEDASEDQPLDEGEFSLKKTEKFFYYGLSTAISFFVIRELNVFFGKAMSGFPCFDEIITTRTDFVMMLVYIPLGIVLYLFFEGCEHVTRGIASKIPAIIKEVICGVMIGVMGVIAPMVLFSGEEQMAELMRTPAIVAPLVLVGICLVKMLMTAFCINFGMKGGHFFPLIFACTCMGFGLAQILFREPFHHAAFAAGIITASMLGAQLKKPLTVAFLLLLCFSARFVFWLFLAAVAGSAAGKLLCGSKQAKVNENDIS